MQVLASSLIHYLNINIILNILVHTLKNESSSFHLVFKEPLKNHIDIVYDSAVIVNDNDGAGRSL